MSMTVDQETLGVLGAGRVEGGLYFLPPTQLARPLYEKVNKVLVALGGRWDRKSRAHLFDRDAEDAISDVLLTGKAVNRKQELGFFETPRAVVDELLQAANLGPGMAVLEPSAGQGAIAGVIAERYPTALITCCELDPENSRVLEQRLGQEVFNLDFLATKPDSGGRYDRVVMNPPFARQADIDHVLHAWRWLKPGGRLVSVMSASILFRENRKTADFRAFAEGHGSIHPLPEGAFRSSRTDVRTCYVAADKLEAQP